MRASECPDTTKALAYIRINFVTNVRRLTEHPNYQCRALRTLALTPFGFAVAF